MKYTIYSRNLEKATKRLDRIAKKASKYGVEFGYTVSDEYAKGVAIYEIDYINHCKHYCTTIHVSAVDVEVDCEGLICSDGWTVLARIEHGDKGNIVTAFGDVEIQNEWYSIRSHCDHCGTDRRRTFTYMVEKDGEVKQVGRSCLKDYTGIDPATALMWTQIHDGMDIDEEADWSFVSNHRSHVMYSIAEVLGFACDEIKAHGYRKVDYTNSTRDSVDSDLRNKKRPTAEGQEKAKKIIEWLKGVSDGSIGIERDCKALALSGWVKERHLGRLCYIPVAYDKEMERLQKEAERKAKAEAEAEGSEYVGSVGERITIKATEAVLLTSWETMYGTTRLYKFMDENGNMLVWKATSYIEPKSGMVIVGTVKAHDEYAGVKQTTLTRCRVVD